jgi:membrane-bound inhibitor of C-type lysozyme
MKLVLAVSWAASCALALIACTPQQEAEGEVFTFACANGKSFTVSYDEATTHATVKAGGATHKLPSVISGSGARYSDGKVEFWEHQGEATLTGADDGPYDRCPRKDPS